VYHDAQDVGAKQVDERVRVWDSDSLLLFADAEERGIEECDARFL
jgi:hypothetical protein